MAFLRASRIAASAWCRPVARRWIGSLLLLLVCGLHPAASRAAEADPEVPLKAALIYRFTTLTEWPESAFPAPDAPVVIEVVGRHPLEAALRTVIHGKKIGSHPVVVVSDNASETASAPHVLVVADCPREQMSAVLAKVSGKPVLTLSDLSGFTSAGGMLRIRRDGSRLSFDVNIRALRQVETVGLKLNPQVLKLGRLVEGGDDE
jgi:hypothetical protein